MEKILIVITTDFVPYGGLTTVMMNYYRSMDKSDLEIDFASTNDIDNKSLAELSKNGSKYYNLGERKKNPIGYLFNLYKLLHKGSYDVIHVNGNSSTMMLELLVACICKIPIRIAHGHTTQSNYPLLHKLLYPFFKKTYTHGVVTSDKAGKWLFKENYTVLNNAIDIEKYKYSVDIRERKRKELSIEDKLVIGNVGKLNLPKNHSFLIDVFEEIYSRRKDAVLVIAGGGELEESLKNKCKEKNIENQVVFLGMLDDTSEIYQAFDVFVFTSIFEGLGMVLIEAQAAGLRCISSDVVPNETKVTDNIFYLSLNSSKEVWADTILKNAEYDRELKAMVVEKSITESGYNIKNEAHKLKLLYKA